MAFRAVSSKRFMLPLAATVSAGTFLLIPKTTLHAEEPQYANFSRKPIYDDPLPRTTTPKFTASNPDTSSLLSSSAPTPTDRLATQIRRSRLFLHAHTSALETGLNNAMTRALSLENTFTYTIASLAPAPQTGETLLPGALYVLVAAMAGSIVTRNRNILLRASVPLAVGIGAGWVVLPHTMRNVGDLMWRFEERAPIVALNHLRVRGAVEQGWKEVRGKGEVVSAWADERVREGREMVEGWVRKGR